VIPVGERRIRRMDGWVAKELEWKKMKKNNVSDVVV
jgi:hypothetical protein